jgi:hypothetical protein
MSKPEIVKSEPKTETPKAIEAIRSITDVVLSFRQNAKPTLAEVA